MLARFWKSTLAVTLSLIFTVPGFGADTTVTLPAPVADTTLFRANPDNNLGHSDVVSGTTREGEHSRGLIKFNVASQIPSNAVITSVQVSGRVVKLPSTAPTASTFGLHRLLVDWGEGTKGGNTGSAATANEATWNARFHPDTEWSASGGAAPADYAATASSSMLVNTIRAYEWSSTPSLVADVQAWVANPAANFGWILISQSENTSSTARRFGSRETGNPFSLTVTYSLGAAPSATIENPR